MTKGAASKGRVLIVDDEASIARTFRYCLEDDGYEVVTAQTATQALAQISARVFDLCFLDLMLGEEHGLELLPKLRAQVPWLRVVVATAHSAVDTAVEAMRAGAADYIVKPCSPDQLRLAAAQQMQAREMETRIENLEAELQQRSNGEVRSDNPAMAQVLDTCRQVAPTDANVLILGESGTGKGVVARSIHQLSTRARKAFVTINCPSLSAELLESELFGHTKGAFTGATESTLGRVHHADGGTLFLDEIGDFPISLQAKLLRFIQDKEYERLGDPVTRIADVRIVAATNRDLAERVKQGLFREDLWYRLNVITVTLPPLRERPEDILGFAEAFLVRYVKQYARPARSLSAAACQVLVDYRWPGNVRELQNVIERASILCPDAEIQPRHLSLGGATAEEPSEFKARAGERVTLEELERAHIIATLGSSETLEEAARVLGIDASTLYRKRKQLGL